MRKPKLMRVNGKISLICPENVYIVIKYCPLNETFPLLIFLFSFMKDDSIPLPSGFQGGLNFTYVLRSGKGR